MDLYSLDLEVLELLNDKAVKGLDRPTTPLKSRAPASKTARNGTKPAAGTSYSRSVLAALHNGTPTRPSAIQRPAQPAQAAPQATTRKVTTGHPATPGSKAHGPAKHVTAKLQHVESALRGHTTYTADPMGVCRGSSEVRDADSLPDQGSSLGTSSLFCLAGIGGPVHRQLLAPSDTTSLRDSGPQVQAATWDTASSNLHMRSGDAAAASQLQADPSLEAARTREMHLLARLDQLSSRLEAAVAAEAAAKQRAAELAAVIKGSGIARQMMHKQLDSARKATGTAEEEKQLLKRRVAALQQFLSQEQSARRTLEERLKQQEQQITVLQTQVEASRQQVLMLQECVASTGHAHEARKQAELQVLGLQRQLQEREGDVRASEQQLRMLSVKNQHLEQQVAGLQAALEQMYVAKIGNEQLQHLLQQLAQQDPGPPCPSSSHPPSGSVHHVLDQCHDTTAWQSARMDCRSPTCALQSRCSEYHQQRPSRWCAPEPHPQPPGHQQSHVHNKQLHTGTRQGSPVQDSACWSGPEPCQRLDLACTSSQVCPPPTQPSQQPRVVHIQLDAGASNSVDNNSNTSQHLDCVALQQPAATATKDVPAVIRMSPEPPDDVLATRGTVAAPTGSDVTRSHAPGPGDLHHTQAAAVRELGVALAQSLNATCSNGTCQGSSGGGVLHVESQDGLGEAEGQEETPGLQRGSQAAWQSKASVGQRDPLLLSGQLVDEAAEMLAALQRLGQGAPTAAGSGPVRTAADVSCRQWSPSPLASSRDAAWWQPQTSEAQSDGLCSGSDGGKADARLQVWDRMVEKGTGGRRRSASTPRRRRRQHGADAALQKIVRQTASPPRQYAAMRKVPTDAMRVPALLRQSRTTRADGSISQPVRGQARPSLHPCGVGQATTAAAPPAHASRHQTPTHRGRNPGLSHAGPHSEVHRPCSRSKESDQVSVLRMDQSDSGSQSDRAAARRSFNSSGESSCGHLADSAVHSRARQGTHDSDDSSGSVCRADSTRPATALQQRPEAAVGRQRRRSATWLVELAARRAPAATAAQTGGADTSDDD